MSEYLNTLSAAARNDLVKVVERWTGDNVDIAKAIKAESRDYRSYSEKSFARVVGAAYATVSLYRADMVGKGKTYEGTQAIADAFGLSSKGNVTRWHMLGRIMVVGGVTPDTDLYADIQKNNLHAGESVKALIKQDTFSADDVQKAVDADKARKAAAAAKPGKTADEKKADEKAAAEKAVREAVAAMLPQDRATWIAEQIKVLAEDERTAAKHIATVSTALKAGIDLHKSLAAQRAEAKKAVADATAA